MSGPYDSAQLDDVIGSVIRDDANAQSAAIRGNLADAQAVNPDQEADYQKVARLSGLPVNVVRSNPDVVRSQLAAQGIDTDVLAKSYPYLAAYVAHPDQAKLVHDDLPGMAKVERAVGGGALAESAYSVAQGLGGAYNKAAIATNVLLGAIPKLVGGQDAADAWFRAMVDPLVAKQATFEQAPDASFVQKAWHMGGSLLGMISEIMLTSPAAGAGGAAGAASEIPTALDILSRSMGHAARSMAFPALVDAADTQRRVYAETGDAVQAARAATVQYLNTVGFGMTPLSAEGGVLARAATGAVSGGVMGEVSRQAMNLVLPPQMQAPRDPEGIALQALAGTMMGTVMGPRASRPDYYDAVRRTYTDAARSDEAIRTQAQLRGMSEAAQEAKLKERDPEGFKRFVADVAGEGNLPAVFVEGDRLAGALQQSGVDPALLERTMPGVAAQLAEARATKGDVRIPTEDLLAHIAGTPLEPALLDHLKSDPDAMTYGEAKVAKATEVVRLQAQAARVVADSVGDRVAEADRQHVYDQVVTQLDAVNRFPPDVNKAYATLVRDWYTVQADRLGTTPSELFREHPLNVAAERLGEGLEQPPVPRESYRWKATVENAVGPVFHGEHVTLDAFRELPNATDFEPGGFAELGLMGQAAHVTEGARTYAFNIIRDGEVQGNLVADVLDNRIVGIHSLDSYNKEAGLGSAVVGQITASNHEPTQVINALDQSAAFWNKLGVSGLDQYRNGTVDWRGVGDYLAGRSGRAAADVAGESDLARGTGPYQGNEQAARLNQGGEVPRGAYEPATHTLAVLKNADLSTVLHELGHHFLELTAQIAGRENAPAPIKADFDTLLKWFGVPDAQAWDRMTLDERRPYHEQFAKGFERYLMEGKAPSVEMAGLFGRFRSWLLNVYQSVKNLGGELTPEVRGVMDRMLASKDAIETAEAVRGFEPLWKSAADAKMTPEAYARYLETGREASDAAFEDMANRSVRDMRWLSNAKGRAMRELQRTADTQRAVIRSEVTDEVAAQPVYRAETLLRDGMLDAEKVEGNPKLDLDALRTMYGDGPDAPWRALPTGTRGLAGREGTHPDLTAEILGYPSGDALVRDLIAMRPRSDVVGELTDQRMLQQHGELATPGAIERASEQAIHNDARSRFMATGLAALTKSQLPAKMIADAAKEVAEQSIAGKTIAELAPKQYLAAEARANKNAIAAAAKDPTAAANELRAAVLNNRLFKAADAAVDEVAKGLKYLTKAGTSESVNVDYRDQIDRLLDRFDLRKSVTGTERARRQSLLEWVQSEEAQGNEPNVSEGLLDEARRTHYKDMTVEEFRGLVDAVKSIEHLGRLKETLQDGAQRRATSDLVDESVAVIKTLPQAGAGTNRGLSRIESKWLGFKSTLRSADASLLKLEQIIDWLDARDPTGVLNRVVFRPIAERAAWEVTKRNEVAQQLKDLAATLPKDFGKDFSNKIAVPELSDRRAPGQEAQLTKAEIIAMALNYGNESNLDKMARGEGWQPDAIKSVLDRTLTQADWRWVQGVWNTIHQFWPDIVAMERRLGNDAPPKVEARGFDTPFGRMEGGYYPAAYDPLRSFDVEMNRQRSSDQLFENNYTRVTSYIAKGHTEARTEGYARQIMLSLDVIPRHLAQVIHDLALREAVMNADKLLMHPRMREAISDSLGQEYYKQFRPWLQAIANDKVMDNRGLAFWEGAARYARTTSTMVGLGWRITTMLLHGSSAAANSVGEIGVKWFGDGMGDFVKSPIDAYRFVTERSPEMANRFREFDRDVRDGLRDIEARAAGGVEGPLTAASDEVRRFAYFGVSISDMASALPTWLGAYHKGMAPESKGGLGLSEEDAGYYAEKSVRNAHGGGGTKDLAAVQRGPEFFKLATMFYSFWSHFYNRQRDIVRLAEGIPAQIGTDNAGARRDFATVLARSWWYYAIPALMHGIIKPSNQGGEDQQDFNLAKWVGEELLLATASSVPIVRDIANAVAQGRDYEATPVASLIQSFQRTGTDVAHAMSGDKPVSDRWLKHAITTAGYTFALPLGQPASAVQFLWDIGNGKANPQDLADWYRGLVHGDMRKH